MMKQATLAAPRSTAATILGGARAAFRPSRPSRRASAFLASFLAASAARSAVFSICGDSRFASHALGGRADGGGGCGGARRSVRDRLRCARPDGDSVGIAQVDALEAQLQDARAQVQLLQLHQRLL